MKRNTGLAAGLMLFVGVAMVSAGIDDICSGISNGVFLQNFESCQDYYVCMKNKAVPGKCPAPFVFNVDVQKCDWQRNVKCFECPSNSELATYPYEKSCSMYILCFAGQPVVRECAEGTQFDRASGRCDLIERVDCQTAMCPRTNDPAHIVFLPSKAQCDKYYICLDGKPHERQCAPGLQFNSKINACDRPNNVRCMSYSGRANDEPLYRPLEISDKFTCPAKGIGFHPHHKSCSQYIYCLNGNAAVLSCAHGLHFNAEKQVCQKPEKAGCKKE